MNSINTQPTNQQHYQNKLEPLEPIQVEKVFFAPPENLKDNKLFMACYSKYLDRESINSYEISRPANCSVAAFRQQKADLFMAQPQPLLLELFGDRSKIEFSERMNF